MKAIFKIQWENGTPQLPDGHNINGVSAMEPITFSGLINAMVEADYKTIEALKNDLGFVDYIKE